MSDKITIRNSAEFGVELCLSVPYAYWLHKNNQLDGVVTSKGMKPFYYFSDNVKEDFNERTIDNSAAGLDDLPNNWIHGLKPEEEPAILDYSQWELPPYKEHYKNKEFDFGKTVMILNKYNMEHGHKPYGYFDFESLAEMFRYLTEKGYTVIYKRPTNRESGITIDTNEIGSLYNDLDLVANVEGVGVINDHQLTKYFPNVILFDDIVNDNQQFSYNEIQLKVMANVDKFISPCGGNAILACSWGVPVMIYVNQGREFRPNYFGENSYWVKLANSKVIPIFDFITEINDENNNYGHKLNKTGKNDYSELLKVMKEEF